MRISLAYANRSDLSTALKWKLTLEDHIRSNPRVRQWYWAYFHAKPWLRSSIDACLLLIVMVPLLLALLCQAAVGGMLGHGEEYDGAGGLVLYGCIIVALAFVHPIGLVLLALTGIAVPLLWLTMTVFDELDVELRRIVAQHASAARTAHPRPF